MIVSFEESDRQITLLALHQLAQQRPGWAGLIALIQKRLQPLGRPLEWPAEDALLCLRCKRELPASQLVTTCTGGSYCLLCLPVVEVCRGCGCTDEVACPGGCALAAPGLCSTCSASGM